MKVIEFQPPKRDIHEGLEQLAQQARDGRLKDYVLVAVIDNEYETHTTASIETTLALASFLQHWAARKYFT